MEEARWKVERGPVSQSELAPMATIEFSVDGSALHEIGFEAAKNGMESRQLRSVKTEVEEQFTSLLMSPEGLADGEWVRATVTVFSDGASRVCFDERRPSDPAGWKMSELVRRALGVTRDVQT